MARIDDYIAAKNMAVQKLSIESFDGIAQRTEFEVSGPGEFRVPFLDQTYIVSFPAFDFVNETDMNREVPIQEQILILHYMLTPPLPGPAGNWVAYREIPGASFYFSAFVKRAIDPVKKVFGQNISGLVAASKKLHGNPVEPGDAAFEFKVFHDVSLRLILWRGDEEFPPEANILFDETVGQIFSPEDIAWLSGMLVYRLIAFSR